MRNFAKLYYYYHSVPIILLRFLIFLFLISISISAFLHQGNVKLPLFILSWYVQWEIFFRYKIAKLTPSIPVTKITNNWYSAFTLSALVVLEKKDILNTLFTNKSVEFFLLKADITKEQVKRLPLPMERIAAYAIVLVRNFEGRFVTPVDLFCSYLLLTEDTTKLLFEKSLKKEELMQILVWTRGMFKKEETVYPRRVTLLTEGIGEEWVFGWTIETKKYMIDLTSRIFQEKQALFDRENEYVQLVESLHKNTSVLLVGEPGVGKRAIAEKFALESMRGTLKGRLYHQRLFELMVDALLAGSSESDLSERIEEVISEISHAGNVIIYIPDFERVLGSGFHLNISGILAPYLQKGIIRLIASTTPSSYQKYIQPLSSFSQLLSVIYVEQPSEQTTLGMLFEKTAYLEKKFAVTITYKAVTQALSLGPKYARTSLPAAAVTLLEDCANDSRLSGKKVVKAEEVMRLFEMKTKIPIGLPENKEKETLLHLEDIMHKDLIDQEEAVHSLSQAMRRLRTQPQSKKPMSFLFLGPTGVGKTEAAKTLSRAYFGSSDMLRFDMSEYATEEGVKRLLGSLPGEEIGKGFLTEAVFLHPFSLVLLDEFEKAHPKILNLFLQVLDDGRLTDNSGKTVSFSDCIIIATSNAGSEYIREALQRGTIIDSAFKKTIINSLQEKGVYTPELLNRFDDIVVFKPLGEKEAKDITLLFLKRLEKKFEKEDIFLTFEDSLIEKIAKEGFDQTLGARPLQRYIQDNIEDLLSKKILENEIRRGNSVTVSAPDSYITLTVHPVSTNETT